MGPNGENTSAPSKFSLMGTGIGFASYRSIFRLFICLFLLSYEIKLIRIALDFGHFDEWVCSFLCNQKTP